MEAEIEDFINDDLQILNDSINPSSSKGKATDDSRLEKEKPSKKLRKCTSEVWKSFTIKGVVDGKEKAKCNGCERKYIVGSGKIGTSKLARHIPKCPAHFVDENWKLNNKILSFCKMEPPHTGIELANKVFECLKQWGIDRKVFSLTLDNAYANDNMQDILKEQLCSQNSLLCNGDFFHVRCCAHILNLIVQEAFSFGSRVSNKYRCSLLPDNVQALICTRNWLNDFQINDDDKGAQGDDEASNIVQNIDGSKLSTNATT
ncbi:zinc finger BED domain-containing protein RICESLEEPER 2-like [Senna tora]|uniref:Zinc finger BED domain-containing protein RICESLEEPER 2-like n=1 Tax=Senna tora TaxID=362788 RepID=A0A834T110_9FABA|nr:zinc finger BED domain-containing protein RICESLEEPER 2-like [Senna tora]